MLINQNMIITYDILIIYNCSSTWMESWHITSFGNQTWQWTMIDYQRVYSHQNYISLHIPLHHIRITLYICTVYIYIHIISPSINLSPLLYWFNDPPFPWPSSAVPLVSVARHRPRKLKQRRDTPWAKDSGTPKHRLNTYHKNIYIYNYIELYMCNAVNMYSYLTRFRFIYIFCIYIYVYLWGQEL